MLRFNFYLRDGGIFEALEDRGESVGRVFLDIIKKKVLFLMFFHSDRIENSESVIFLTKIFLVLIFIYVIEESVVSEEKENIPFGIFLL